MPRINSGQPMVSPLQLTGQQNLVADQQVKNLAEEGASRLEQYGPEGAQWAEQLRRDPHAAMQLAESHGGFGAIEQRYRLGALGRQATMQDVLAATGDPMAAQQFGVGSQGEANAEARRAETNAVWGGGLGGDGQPGEGGQLGGGMGQLDRIKLARAMTSDRPEQIQKYQEREMYGGFEDMASLDARRKETKERVAPVREYNKDQRRLKQMTDRGLNAQDVVELVNMWQRRVDPGAVVRDQDVELQKRAMISGNAALQAYLGSLTDADKAFPESMRKQLVSSIGEMLKLEKLGLLEAADSLDSWADRNRWNDRAKARGIPFYEEIATLRGQEISPEAEAEVAEVSAVEDNPQFPLPEGMNVRERTVDGEYEYNPADGQYHPIEGQ